MDQEVHVDELSRLSAVRADSCLSIPATITTAVASASISKPDATATVATVAVATVAIAAVAIAVTAFSAATELDVRCVVC